MEIILADTYCVLRARSMLTILNWSSQQPYNNHYYTDFTDEENEAKSGFRLVNEEAMIQKKAAQFPWTLTIYVAHRQGDTIFQGKK